MNYILYVLLLTTSIIIAQAPIAGALYLDGDGDYVKIEDDPLLRLDDCDYTIEAIIKLDSYNSWWQSVIVSKRKASFKEGYFYSITGEPNSSEVRYRAHGQISQGMDPRIVGKTTLLLNTYYHIAFVFHKDAQMVRIFINGKFDSVQLGFPSPVSGIDEELNIGRDPRTELYYFDGIIDELRIWSVARSKEEIHQHKDGELPEEVYKDSKSGLLAYYKFNKTENLGIGDDGLADDIRDYSLNGFHGDLKGDAIIK